MRKQLTVILALAMIAGSVADAGTVSNQSFDAPGPTVNVSTLVPQIPGKPDYDKEVLAPLHQAQQVIAEKAARDKTEADKIEADRLVREAQELADRQAAQVATRSQPAQAVTFASTDGLTGSLGYSLPYGNCVNEPGVNNPGFGNPIVWPVVSLVPYIGATVLFTFNHTAVVSGIWSDGSIEVRQQNSPGMSHRISMAMIRGFR